ncbi:uncharacterized protein KIAA0825-like isoform X2 [Dendronephthya gigantea]|uniref:uncharacterized protein KIAA0825-like isoform X2 n=1 Tax=Dendronephthya gigantea TaxID=151771 RepID=UPI001069871A|nr:uncharacterized protein KIAA0825-like isoform X2 [Dendronephthya gigantea]
MAEEEILSDFDLDLALEGLAMRGDVNEMEKLVKTLGEQIKLSKESMKKEWKALTEEAQICMETDATSIKDFTQYLQDKVELEGHMCSTEPINLNVFLTNVVQALERNVGQEENILDELTSFASEQGFILPNPDIESSIDNIQQSTASLNIVLSENEETTTSLWDRIRSKIGRGLLTSIDKLDPNQSKSEFEMVMFGEKIKLLEKLCILYSRGDVWRKYMSIRNQQLKRALQNPEKLEIKEVEHAVATDEDMSAEAMCLERVSHVLDTMFEEDYNIISLGMFPEAAQMQSEEVYNVYLKDFKNKLREVIERLNTLGRRGSEKPEDSAGNTLSKRIFLALRQCLLAASEADACTKKFLLSLTQQNSGETRHMLGGDFGSSFSLSSISTSQVEVNSTGDASSSEIFPEDVVRDEPEDLDTDEHIWSWQEEFVPMVSKLALAITEIIQSETRAALQNEMAEYEKSHTSYAAEEIPEIPIMDVSDYPKLISKSCSVIMAKLDELAPFLFLSPGKEFEAVRNSYIESLTTCLMSYQSRLVQISSDVPRSSPVRNLYLAFNSAIFIKLELRRFEESYGNIAGSLSAVYSDLVESLNEKILNYHFSTIATVVLQDVYSHHWMNQKEFFEGERCSFSVQMWNYYMQGLQHDLWLVCPPLKSQYIFTSVVQYSLACFVRRYSKVLPSYKRTKLFRSDITSILFIVSSWMIFPVATTCTDLFNPQPTRNVILDIHNSCSALLAIMTIVTCPLETLCLFTSGGGEELIKEGASTTTSWLSWLQPELYGERTKSLTSLSDTQAVNIVFRVMINQPSPLWQLVLQTVLLRDSYLAVTIVTYLEHQHIYSDNEDDPPSQTRKRSVQFGDVDGDYSKIVESLYYVILKCSKRSTSLVNFVIALINRENSWQMFSSTEGLRLGEEDKIPVWLDCLFSTFKPFVQRLTDLASSTLSVKDKPAAKPFRFASMSSLPCGCHVNKREVPRTVDTTVLVFSMFERVLKTLASTVRLLPNILLKLFTRIEDDLRQLRLTSDETPSAGVKLLGSMLYRVFSSVSCENVPDGSRCQEDVINDCKTLAQILYHVLLGDMKGLFETCNLSSALETMIKNKKDWIQDQVRKIGDIICESAGDEPSTECDQDGSFQDLQFRVRSKELSLDSKGQESLKQVYNFFAAKKDWILRRIPLVSHLGPLQHPSKTRGTPDTFNPHYAYTNLGEYSFNHESLENFPFDWEQMIQGNIGMSLRSFKRLVFNRYELQNEKEVEPDQIELVEKLKAFYDPETS